MDLLRENDNLKISDEEIELAEIILQRLFLKNKKQQRETLKQEMFEKFGARLAEFRQPIVKRPKFTKKNNRLYSVRQGSPP